MGDPGAALEACCAVVGFESGAMSGGEPGRDDPSAGVRAGQPGPSDHDDACQEAAGAASLLDPGLGTGPIERKAGREITPRAASARAPVPAAAPGPAVRGG